MSLIMALHVASAVISSGVLEFQPSGRGIRTNDSCIEINQVTVVQQCALNGTNAVSIVTCRAGNLLLQMFGMLCETFVVQDAVSAVAFIAKLVRV
jgi:hypothetical protein